MIRISPYPAQAVDCARPRSPGWPSVRSIIFALLVLKIVLDVIQRRRRAARLAHVEQAELRFAARRIL